MSYYSDFSSPVMYTTAVAAPSQPDPPMLSEQFVSALTVSWIRRPGDDVFMLHMDDESKVSCPLHIHMQADSMRSLLSTLSSVASFLLHSPHTVSRSLINIILSDLYAWACMLA